MRKSFSGNAVATTLGGGISPTSMILNVGATTGWPDTTTGPFVITIDRGQGSLEEKVLISSFSGGTLTVETRGWDGTTPQSHSSGAAVVHTLDADTINTHDDVVAGVGSVTPSTSAVGDSAADGSSIFPAAADHKHARESFATGVTAASAPGDTRNDGSSASPARADHKHARESVAALVADVSPSLLGLPLALTGAVAPTRYVGGTASGAPTSGTFAQGDFVIDSTGTIWICTAPGSPGTWVTPGPVGKPSGRCYASTGSALAGGDSLVTLDTEDYVNGNVTFQSTAGNTGLVIVTPGTYRISGQVKIQATASDLLTAFVAKNTDATKLGYGSTATVAGSAFQASVVTCQRKLVANDVVNLGYTGLANITPFQIDPNSSSNYLEVELVTQ